MLKKEQQEQILNYCIDNKTRMPNLEYYLTDPRVCYYYALEVINGRFELGEPHISNNGYYSYYYAMNILNSRLKLAEPAIKNSRYWKDYKQYFKIKD